MNVWASRSAAAGSEPRRPASFARRAVGRTAATLVKPDSNRVCFATIPDFSDSGYWMFRHLLEARSGLHITWLLHDASMADQVEADFRESGRSAHHELEVVPWHSPRAYVSYLRSGVVFHTHGVFNFSGSRSDQTIVSLWHGMPLKAIGALDVDGIWANDVGGDIHLSSSRLYRSVISAAFAADPRSVLVTGLPRNDVLKGFVSPVKDRGALASLLGLDPERPIVAWLPTHRNDTESNRDASFLDQVNSDVIDALADSCSRHGCQVVVKLHYLDALNHVAPGDGPNLPFSFITTDEWARSGIQLYDLLAASDGLITDLSSVIIDFLHTRRPIGIIGYDESTYARDMIVPLGPLTASGAVFDATEVAGIEPFVAAVGRREVVTLADNDVAHWVNEDGDLHSAEAIAEAAGL